MEEDNEGGIEVDRDVLARGLLYAIRLIGGGNRIIGGMTPEDVVSEACVRILAGTRHGDTFEQALFMAIRSLIYRLRWRQSLLTTLEAASDVPAPASSDSTPQGIAEQLTKLFASDEEASQVLGCWLNDVYKAKQIAKALGWPIARVYIVSRRMRRRARSVLPRPR